MKVRSHLLAAACATGAAALFAGCSNGGTTDNTATPSPSGSGSGTPSASTTAGGGGTTPATLATVAPDKPLKLAFITNGPSDFWKFAQAGCNKAASELKGVSVDFKNPPNGTPAEQKGIIDDLIVNGEDGFAISPRDPTNQTAMLNDAAKQALVVTQDSDAPNSNRLCYIGTNNVAAGNQAGEQLKKALPNGGNVMVFVGTLDAQNSKDRLKGITDVIKGTKIKILDVRTDENDRGKAKSNVSDTLVKYPDISALVGLWSYNGPAILSATQQAGKVGKVKIVCFDEADETLAGVASGAIQATVVQQPYQFGYQAIKMMEAVRRGKTPPEKIPANKQIFVPTLIIDKAAAPAFITKVHTLLGK